MRTFKQLGDDVMNYLARAGETGLTWEVVKDTLRRVHTSRVVERKWNFMLYPVPQTLTTTIGVKRYSLHQSFFRPLYIYNQSTKTPLTQLTEATLLNGLTNEVNYDVAGATSGDFLTQTGSANTFKFNGISSVQAQPSSASVLTVSGEVGKSVTVYGDTEDGLNSETLTSGTPGSIQFTHITKVVKDVDWTQTLTLSAGAETLLKLNANEYGREYKQLELIESPTKSETLVYQFYRKPFILENDNDIPDIPSEFSSIIVYDGLIQLAQFNKNLTGNILNYWLAQQAKLESGLIDFDLGNDVLGAQSDYVTYIPR